MSRHVALLLVLALLWAQWATAAYVCPREGAPPVAAEPMPDCSGMSVAAMDPDQPQLCKAHCEKGTQSVNATPQPEPATAFSILAVLDWQAATLLPERTGARSAGDEAAAQSPPGAPPIYITLRVLRH